jgi:hypothetical protein
MKKEYTFPQSLIQFLLTSYTIYDTYARFPLDLRVKTVFNAAVNLLHNQCESVCFGHGILG